MENKTEIKSVLKSELKLAENQKASLQSYLNTKFAPFGIRTYEGKILLANQEVIKLSYPLEVNKYSAGIFLTALTSVNIIVRLWKDKDSFNGNVSLEYTHIGGGSNGCDTNVKFTIFDEVNNKGKIIENY